MPGDFDDRLAAVDDALDATDSQATARGGTVDGREFGDDDAGLGADAGPSPGEDGVANESTGGHDVAADVSALTERVAELEAAVQALRGYAGSVRAVNDRVEERADAAVATTDSLVDRVDELESRLADRRDAGGGVARHTQRGSRTGEESRRDDKAGTCRCGGRVPSEPKRAAASNREASRGESQTAPREGSPPPSRADSQMGSRAEPQTGSRSESRGESGGSTVAWPPENPREPYGDVDADDDRERSGLVARLRDAL